MEAIKQVVRIPENHEVKIKIPQYMPENDLVEVILILKKKPDDFEEKISEIKTAMKDDLFLNDLNEISEEFETIDIQEWTK